MIGSLTTCVEKWPITWNNFLYYMCYGPLTPNLASYLAKRETIGLRLVLGCYIGSTKRKTKEF